MQDNKLNKKQEETKGETNVSPLSLQNIYSRINISVKTLDRIILILILGLINSYLNRHE